MTGNGNHPGEGEIVEVLQITDLHQDPSSLPDFVRHHAALLIEADPEVRLQYDTDFCSEEGLLSWLGYVDTRQLSSPKRKRARMVE